MVGLTLTSRIGGGASITTLCCRRTNLGVKLHHVQHIQVDSLQTFSMSAFLCFQGTIASIRTILDYSLLSYPHQRTDQETSCGQLCWPFLCDKYFWHFSLTREMDPQLCLTVGTGKHDLDCVSQGLR